MKKKISIENEIKIIDLYVYENKSTCYISKLFNTNTNLIRNLLIRNDIKLRKNSENSKKYKVNEDYFNDINTNEKAYFIGLLFADGNIAKKTLHTSISLKEDDAYILDYFLKKIYENRELEYIPKKTKLFNDSIVESLPQKKLSIQNKKIGNDLLKIGLIPNKTHILKFPIINKIFYPSFILGYFDGDGCIYKSKSVKNNFLINFAGCEGFLIEVQNILINELGLNKTKLQKHKNIFYLRYSGKNNIKKIFSYMYNNDNICLKRKKDVFEQILN